MTPEDILNTRIDRAIREIVDLDHTIAKASGRVSFGMTEAKTLSALLKANARLGIYLSRKEGNE